MPQNQMLLCEARIERLEVKIQSNVFAKRWQPNSHKLLSFWIFRSVRKSQGTVHFKSLANKLISWCKKWKKYSLTILCEQPHLNFSLRDIPMMHYVNKELYYSLPHAWGMKFIYRLIQSETFVSTFLLNTWSLSSLYTCLEWRQCSDCIVCWHHSHWCVIN